MIRRIGKKKGSHLLRSSRGQFFNGRSSSKRLSIGGKRHQKIRFRHQYVTAVLKDVGFRFWNFLKWFVVIGSVAWGSIFLVHFWQTSPYLRIRGIKFIGDIPTKLPEVVSFRPGENIFFVNTSREEKDILREFPELKSVSLWRTPLREIVVSSEFRIPVAVCEKEGELSGIDSSGFIFPFTKENQAKEFLPLIRGFRKGDLPGLMKDLLLLKKETPDFYSLIIRLETDTMNSINFELRDQIFIFWGELEERNLILKAKRVGEVLERFVPLKKPAKLRFVTENRLVIDSSWMAKENEKI